MLSCFCGLREVSNSILFREAVVVGLPSCHALESKDTVSTMVGIEDLRLL